MSDTTQRDAVALLKADHRAVEALFEKFEDTKNAGKQQTLALQICTELMIHTIIEEEIFYPACQGKIEEDLLEEAYVEHDGAKVLIAELLGSEPDSAFYAAKMKVLSEEIKHHVSEEEKRSEGMFAQARAAGLDMDELGEQMTARKEALKAEFKENGLPPPQTRSFTGHKLDQSAPVHTGR
jgi:hypothetical protein